MTPDELKQIRKSLGFSIKEMSEVLETPYRTYQDWELGNRRIPGVCEVAVSCLLRSKRALKARRKKHLIKKGKKKIKKEVYIMGREVVLFETEERKNRSEIATFLRMLADKIESGNVTLKSGANEITLTLPQNLIFETKVEEEQKKGKLKKSLEVEIEWIVGEGGEADEGVQLA